MKVLSLIAQRSKVYFKSLNTSFPLFFTIALFAQGPLPTDKMSLAKEEVQAAVLDYVEALYLADSTRIEASVHPELRKRGYWNSEEKEKYYDNLDMTFHQLRKLAGTWNANGDQANESSVKKIEIYDVNDKTASAKLTAKWGMDYFHLAKLDGKWMIMNVLWQSLKE